MCHEHWETLHSFARRRLRGKEADAEDFVQDAMERYLKEFQGRQPPERPGAWLMRTLHNLLISDWRQRLFRQKAAGDVLLLTPSPDAASQVSTMLESVPVDAFAEAVRALSPKLKQVYDLHVLGLGHAEIGRRLGVSEGTVAKRLFDARKRLRAAVVGARPGGHAS